jgi:uncharacterized protein YlxW (UPF0749 family)
LAARVSLRAEQVAEQTTANRVLADQVAGAEAIALSQADPSAARLASQLVIASGSSAVQGPGWRIQLTQPPEPTAAEQQITAGDLRSIVNGLWYAGAQAVAINQVRLAANAPISMAGESVLVDLVPVMPPYTIEVIGDVADLSKRFANGPASDRISLLKDRFSIRVSFATVSNLVLPAANRVGVFHYAKTLESGDNLP